MRKLFGTDGIRGVAGEAPLDRKTVFCIGRALGIYLMRSHKNAHVVLGQDTRESGDWIARTLAAGLAAAGVSAESAGVITTPGIAHLARTRDFAAGLVISASHNPWTDNGIKVFGHDGYKLSDEAELEIEREIFRELEDNNVAPGELDLKPDRTLDHDYVRWLLQHVTAKTAELRLVVDCANGAASDLAPELFSKLAAKADFIHHTPNGRNINEKCGALHPEVVAAEVRSRKADLGICFDGDADRALFADAHGNVVNGDAVLLLAAREMQSRGTLANQTVVATTMSNMGLEAALRRSNITLRRAAVGDKYVLEEMKKTGAVLGGEQSGHIIFGDTDATTGDGLLTALYLMQILTRAAKPLHELLTDFKVYPQVIRNIRVREKKPFNEVPAIAQSIAQAEAQLNGNGRVVVRYSGTEKLARVMVEAEDEARMNSIASTISGTIEKALGES
jgi:phosphoglucosamine mutase